MKRREFTQSIGCGLAAGGVSSVLSGCRTTGSAAIQEVSLNENQELVVARREVDAAPGAFVLVPHPRSAYPIAVLHNGPDRYHACLMSCTHQACVTVPQEEEIVCPCHGARFNREGQVTRRPATRNLLTFPVRVAGDTLYVRVG